MDADTAIDFTCDAAALVQNGRHSTSTLKDGTGVLLNLQGMSVVTLNEAGMTLLRVLQRPGTHSMEELVQVLCSRFEVNEETARRDASAFLALLVQELSAIRQQE